MFDMIISVILGNLFTLLGVSLVYCVLNPPKEEDETK
jgi:hypothetical protein